MKHIINLPVLQKDTDEIKEIILFYVKYILRKLKLFISTDLAIKLIHTEIKKSLPPEVSIKTSGNGNVISKLKAYNNTIRAEKIYINPNIKVTNYPRVRWARHGHIDLDNCKDIDYILVPCRTKCQLLTVTNSYLKELSGEINIAQTLGYENVSVLSVLLLMSNWLSDENTIIPNEDLSTNLLPCSTDILWSRRKDREHVWSDNLYLYTKLLYLNRRLRFNKIIGNNFTFLLHEIKTFNRYDQFFYRSDKETIINNLKDKTLSKVPCMVFKNPFTVVHGGGIIPVKNGRLLLEEARMCRETDHLLLVSSGELLEFDHVGRCKSLLRPNYRKAWRVDIGDCYKRIFAGYNKSEGTCFGREAIFPRRGITAMAKLFMQYHRDKWIDIHPSKPVHSSRMFPFIWKDPSFKSQESHRRRIRGVVNGATHFWQLSLHLYVTIWARLFSPSRWSYFYEPHNCVAFRNNDLYYIIYKYINRFGHYFSGIWHSNVLYTGYGDPFGRFLTNRYADILKFKIKIDYSAGRISLINIT